VSAHWEYRKLDLNSAPAKADDPALLNGAGAEAWALVTITANCVAYLKRAIPQEAAPATPSQAVGAISSAVTGLRSTH
jgi:hypothetical protein